MIYLCLKSCVVVKMNEIWKDVYYTQNGTLYDFIGYYQISSEGRVKSLKREIVDKNGKKYTLNEKILNGHKNNDGYTVVTLRNEKIKKQEYIHRLVGYMFIPNEDDKPEIDHIIPVADGGSNAVDNLRWVTSKENTNNPLSKKKSDLSKIGRNPSEKCINSAKKVLIIDKVVGINKNTKETLIFESAEEGKRHGFRHILECCRGIRTVDKGYNWWFYSVALEMGLINEEEE